MILVFTASFLDWIWNFPPWLFVTAVVSLHFLSHHFFVSLVLRMHQKRFRCHKFSFFYSVICVHFQFAWRILGIYWAWLSLRFTCYTSRCHRVYHMLSHAITHALTWHVRFRSQSSTLCHLRARCLVVVALRPSTFLSHLDMLPIACSVSLLLGQNRSHCFIWWARRVWQRQRQRQFHRQFQNRRRFFGSMR